MKNRITLLSIFALLAMVSCKKVESAKEPAPVETTLKHDANHENHEEAGAAETSAETTKTNPNGKFASMNFIKKVHDFGKIKADAKVETIFEFVNDGKADLIITEAKGSCGCTVPEFPKKPIKIGEKGIIKVLFDAAKKTGEQSKSVTINANTATGMEILEIKANVLPKN